jgi:hypothetical protein
MNAKKFEEEFLKLVPFISIRKFILKAKTS